MHKIEIDQRLSTYISSLRTALPRHFAPGERYHGEHGAKLLAREVGYGLADFSDAQIQHVRVTLYSDFLVRFTFSSASGVPIDNATFQQEIDKGIAASRSYTPHEERTH